MFQRFKIINILVLILLLSIFFGLLNLVIDEFNYANVCPKLLGIPACYIIFGFVIVVLYAHFKKHTRIFFIAASVPFVIAIVASMMQFSGSAECPKTGSGIPMCYLSLLFFAIIISLKIYSNRLITQN